MVPVFFAADVFAADVFADLAPAFAELAVRRPPDFAADFAVDLTVDFFELVLVAGAERFVVVAVERFAVLRPAAFLALSDDDVVVVDLALAVAFWADALGMTKTPSTWNVMSATPHVVPEG